MPIRLDNVSFRFSPEDAVLFDAVTLETSQGKLVAVGGEPGAGRKTFSRLLGQSVHPTEGLIGFPTHLRIVHVSHEPVVLDMSPWDNLTFGDKNADPGRVLGICKKLGLWKLMTLLDKNDLVGADQGISAHAAWADTLRHTEKVGLHLARALIANPEVMVLQRFLHYYDFETGKVIFKVLRQHIAQRGLGLDPRYTHRRRPRTCFFVPDTAMQAMQADVIWEINSHNKKVRPDKTSSGREVVTICL